MRPTTRVRQAALAALWRRRRPHPDNVFPCVSIATASVMRPARVARFFAAAIQRPNWLCWKGVSDAKARRAVSVVARGYGQIGGYHLGLGRRGL
jgi:hypothetical protein